jgi:uncharacterized protein YabE (DUF348 family)
MQAIITPHKRFRLVAAIIIAVFGVMLAVILMRPVHAIGTTTGEHIITVHDDGVDKGFVTTASTVRDALKDGGIRLDQRDRTEPGLDEKLVANSYQINVYHARPVLIRDGTSEITVVTAYRTGEQIATDAHITLHPEDKTTLSASTDPIADGAAEVMTIDRATPFTFVFYGKSEQTYTQAGTIGDMLKTKGIKLASADRTSASLATPITAGMTVTLWREGVQTVTLEEDVPFTTKTVYDADQPTGYKKVQTEGKNGRRTVTYEITTQNGIETARKEINSVATEQATEQVEIIGVKTSGGLTQAKGVNFFEDSSGVTHRETYYDLNMATVVKFCGGSYTVRSDGVKVDQDGYILIAANLSLYPRCSVVETSLGLAKVYDTGDFVSTYPTGYDIATDWTNHNGI